VVREESLFFDNREHVALYLLVGDEHGDVPGGKAEEVRRETLVEGSKAIIFEGLRHTVHYTVVLACHHSCLRDIEGGPKDTGSEAGHRSTQNMQWDTIAHSNVLQDHLFVLVVGGDLSSINH